MRVQLAEDAVVVHGDPTLKGRHALVVRLDPTASPAAGRVAWGVEDHLRAAGMDLETLAVNGSSYNGAGMVRAGISQYRYEFGPEASVVLLVRSSHRFAWQRPILQHLRGHCPEAVVVDMGVPGDDFSTFRGWIQTFGASRLCSQAAARRLLLGQ